MNRRNFFKGLIAAVATGSMLSSAQVEAANLFGFNKYAEMIRLQQDVIDHWSKRDFYCANKKPQLFKEITASKVDTILDFSMNNFVGDTSTDEAIEVCKKVFNDRDYADTMTEEGLRRILEVIVPVAVTRNLLARHRITFDPRDMRNWNRFLGKYQDLILAA